MLTIHSYPIAVALCVLTMICWGSWANTQKLAARSWRFELFYWDFVLGLLLTSLLAALTLGSMGDTGRTFIQDLGHANLSSIGWAMLGGAVWNAGNLLLVAAIAVAGMAIGFPIGGGIAWVLGILINFLLVIAEGGVNPSNQPCMNATMFSPAGTAAFGNQMRNQYRGPKYFDTDFSIKKNFNVPGSENAKIGFGAECFNLFNHPNFALPNNNIASGYFGTITSTVSTPTSILGSFLGGDASPRLIQLSLHLNF